MADNIQTAEEKILENIANPVNTYEVDGEKTTLKDPSKQLEALANYKKLRAARNPLGAIHAFRIPSGEGTR